MNRRTLAAAFALPLLAILACNPLGSVVDKVTGGDSNMTTVSQLWSDVPRMDGLTPSDFLESAPAENARAILRAAALLHAVGHSPRAKKSRKGSYRLIRRLKPPIGWSVDDFRLVVLVVRYHRGTPPAPSRKDLRDLPAERQNLVAVLSGVLRLAVSLAAQRSA